MKNRKNLVVRGLLLGNGWRKAGSMLNKEGKTISWETEYKLTLLLLDGSNSNAIRKLTVQNLRSIPSRRLSPMFIGEP